MENGVENKYRILILGGFNADVIMAPATSSTGEMSITAFEVKIVYTVVKRLRVLFKINIVGLLDQFYM